MPKKKGRTDRVHLAFVIDESGSMGGTQRSVTTGYNEFISTLRGEDTEGKEVRCTLAFFDSHGNEPKVRYRFDGVDLVEMPELAETDYNPRGMTPLNDALSETITKVGKAKRKADRAMVVIITDGQENSSETSTEDLRKLVQASEADGWEFVYLGANVDAFAEAQNIGMAGTPGSYFNYTTSEVGTSNTMRRAGNRAVAYYGGGSGSLAAASAATPDAFVPEDPAEFEAQEKAAMEAAKKAKAEADAKTKSQAAEAASRLLGKE